MIAWLTRSPADVETASAPLATGFMLLVGAANLVAIDRDRPRIARVCSIVLIALGLIVTCGYALDFDWGRDELLPAAINVRFPLEMAPNTGVVVLLFGVATLSLRRRPVLAALGAMLALVLGSVALMGHLFDLPELARWGGTQPMGLIAAFGSILLGGGALGAVLPALRIADPVGYWMSTIAAVLIPGSFVLLLWIGLVSHQDQAVTKATVDVVTAIESSIQRDVYGLRSALEVVATGEPLSSDALERTVTVLAQVCHGFLRLERIGADDQVRAAWGAAIPEADLPVSDDQRAAFAAVREGQKTLIGPALRLPDGRLAFRMITPLSSGKRDELVTAVVDIEEFTRVELDRAAPDFGIRLRAGNVVAYGRDFHPGIHVTTYTDILKPQSQTPWTLLIEPHPELLARLHGGVAELLLGAGGIVMLLLTITLRTTRRSQRYAQGLLEEIGRRREAELHAHTLARELDQRVRNRTAALQEANTALRTENAVRLDAQQRLASSNRDLQRFAAFVSHELKQPLATVSLFADLLATAPAATLQTKGPDYVVKMRRAIARMGRLIDAELALSRGTQSQVQRVRMPLGDLIADLLTELAPALSAVGARVTVGPLPEAWIDAEQIRQVFRNLIENALKYRRPDHAPDIRIEGSATPAGETNPGGCEITVRDNGRGFKPELANDIFEVFRRAVDTDDVQGTGIGLALCRRIIERHGGTITAVGAEELGATFTITLPDPDLAAAAVGAVD